MPQLEDNMHHHTQTSYITIHIKWSRQKLSNTFLGRIVMCSLYENNLEVYFVNYQGRDLL